MKISEWLVKSTEESPGVISAMRLVQVSGVLSIVYVWLFVSLAHVRLEEFPQSVVEVLGVLMLGKVLQSHIETKASS